MFFCSLPPKTYTTGDGDEVQYYEIKRADVLIVGQTGTGKTTFLETLKNPKFRDDCHVVSQTRHASLHHVGFEVGDENYALSIIDTPGLYFMGGERRGKEGRGEGRGGEVFLIISLFFFFLFVSIKNIIN